MLRKKEALTVVTPIPGFIPRQLAISILHSHSEVITLNPLVLGHKPISAPRNASADEFYSTWYEIEERIQYIPGTGKLGSGKISFNGCFHDMPWGLQTHIHAPLGINLRNTYRICGNQPGIEPPEHREIGLEALGAPTNGLYLREDIEIKCNITMVSFVKAQLKAASKEMVQRIIKKAELVDAGVLKAMMEDGKLKTVNPNDRSAASQDRTTKFFEAQQAGANGYLPPTSPQPLGAGQASNLPPSYSPSNPTYAQPYSSASPPPQLYHPQHPSIQSVFAPPPIPPKEQAVAMELPGDYMYYQTSPRLGGSAQPNRNPAQSGSQVVQPVMMTPISMASNPHGGYLSVAKELSAQQDRQW